MGRRAKPAPKAPPKKAAARARPRRPRAPLHPAMQYAADVLAGRVIANELIRLAVERHMRDLKAGRTRGLWFDAEAAQFAIDFFGFLRHSKGKWAGEPFTLQPWQQFFLWVLFGWKRGDGTRRFRVALLEVARKNGKSTLAAGIALLLMLADGEAGAEVYSAATKKDQAKIVWGEAKRMVLKSPDLLKRVGVLKNNLHVLESDSKYEPLGADEDTLDGLNVSAAICDEIHAWKQRGLWDVLETATSARAQPLLLPITTAGSDRKSVCYELHDYASRVLKGHEDDSVFAMIYGIDEKDKWDDERCWVKANPGLHVTVQIDDLRRKATKAREMPAAQNAFRRLHMNEWTEQVTRWLDIGLWDQNGDAVDPDSLVGRPCFGGLDLSSTTDLSAVVWVFPPEEDEETPKWAVLCRFYMPEETLGKRMRQDRVPFNVWREQGYLTATPGNVIDYDQIRADVRADGELFEIRELAFDRYGATQLSTQLAGDGFTMVAFGQGFVSMAAPTRELEKLLLQRALAHGGHPVLRWMAGNVTASMDPAGNRKPDKAKSSERIDGIVALCMAVGRAIVTAVEAASVYEERGLRILGDDD